MSFIFSAVAVKAEDEGLSSEEKALRAKSYYEAGKQLIQQGDYAAADSEFKKAQQLLGAAPVKTTLELEPAPIIEKKPQPSIIIPQEPPRDLKYYIQAVTKEPKNSDLRFNLAVEYLKAEEFRRAERELKYAVQLNPKDKDACYNLGVLYNSYLNDKSKAVYYYGRYLDLVPRAADSMLVKGWIRELQKQIRLDKNYE